MRTRLPNGRSAAYEWGSHAIRLLAPSAPRRGAFMKLFASLTAGVAGWRDDAEFEYTVSILHESVHAAQDLCCGVGLWDFHWRRTHAPGLLRELRMSSWTQPFGKRLSWRRSQAYRDWLDGGLLPRSSRSRSARLREVDERMTLDPNIRRSPTLLSTLALERILEADAVMQVALALRRLGMDEDQRRIMNRHLALWSPPDMARSYEGVYYYVIAELKKCARADRVAAGADLLVTAMFITMLLIDLSLAHPSPQLLAARGLSAADQEPGLKFVMLLSAFAQLSAAETEQCLRSAIAGQIDMAEAMLLSRCAIAYPSSRDIYTDWQRVLAELHPYKGPEDPVVTLRLKAVAARLAHPGAAQSKTPLNMLGTLHLPLMVLRAGDFELPAMDPYYLDKDTAWMLVLALRHELSLWHLLHAAHGGYTFQCPHAEAGTCPAALPLCHSGITSAQQFPDAAACQVRRWLEGSGFGYFHPGPTRL